MPNIVMKEVNGTLGVYTQLISIYFQNNDRIEVDDLYPVKIPNTGTKYSYWKTICFELSALPNSYIDNIRVCGDGSNDMGTGITANVGDETTNVYVQATGVVGSSGDEMVSGHSQITGVTDLFTYTMGSPKSVSISETGNRLDVIGERSNLLILQLEIDTTASDGATGAESLIIIYDEY